MIPSGVEIFVALEPIDLRFSFDRLSGIAQEQIGYDPRSGALFVFYSRRRDALKILFFDGSGMCQFYKRLDRGTFKLPEAPAEGARYVEVDDMTLAAVLDGIDVDTAPRRDMRRPRLRARHDDRRVVRKATCSLPRRTTTCCGSSRSCAHSLRRKTLSSRRKPPSSPRRRRSSRRRRR